MKKLRLVAMVSSSVLVASTGLLAACGDDTVIAIDVDGGNDRPDGALPDGDIGIDAPTPRPDAGPDAEAGVTPTVQNWRELVADGLCSSVTRCCFGNADVPDGGAVDGGGVTGNFNRAACDRIYRQSGFEYSNVGGSAIPFGNVTLDSAKAAECLQKVQALSCELSGTELAAARAACFDAIVGTRAANQDCRNSLECGKGLFCNPTSPGVTDGGVVGRCEPLRAQGESCDIVDTGDDFGDTIRGEEACSWRAGGNTGLRCKSYDPDYLPRDQWTCEPTVAVGEVCNTTVSCNNGICDIETDFVCKSPLRYFDSLCDDVTRF